MRAASAGMIAHLAQDSTTLAWCWKATRRDAQVFGFTTHDQDIVAGGVTYSASTGMDASAAQARAGASVDNMDITGFLGGAAVTEDSIRAGLWDGCAISVSLVNWADTTQVISVQDGTIGNIQLVGQTYVAEMRSLSQALQQVIGRIMSKRCDATFGDTRCGVNLATYTVSGTVTTVTSRRQFGGDTLAALAGGEITWLTGANAGAKAEVESLSGGVSLSLPMDQDIAVGDTYNMASGCDKNAGTCQTTYANIVRFRGFHHIPGIDAVLAYPDPK